jgi:hypothetical protein
MTDLSPAPDANSTDDRREDLELEEAWRAAAAGGYDTEFELHDGTCTCPACGTPFMPTVAALESRVDVRDTASGRTGLVVATLRCPRCGASGRLAAELDALVDADGGSPASPAGDGPTTGTAGPDGEAGRDRDAGQDGESGQDGVRADEVSWRHPPPRGATEERPLGEDRRFFEDASGVAGGNLADGGQLLDEDGDDIREYTGEPVETEEGWVLPQQQNVGPGNMAGGGEWPDPQRPSAQPGTGPGEPAASE